MGKDGDSHLKVGLRCESVDEDLVVADVLLIDVVYPQVVVVLALVDLHPLVLHQPEFAVSQDLFALPPDDSVILRDEVNHGREQDLSSLGGRQYLVRLVDHWLVMVTFS